MRCLLVDRQGTLVIIIIVIGLSLREQRVELLLNLVLSRSTDHFSLAHHIRVLRVLTPVSVVGALADSIFIAHTVTAYSTVRTNSQPSRIVRIRGRLELAQR